MKTVVVAVLTVLSLNAVAQDWAAVPNRVVDSNVRLQVGDRLPFTELHNVINYPKKTMKLSDHKPKLLLLDFWATTCSPCIKFWPTALKLQKEFGDDLQIVPVNSYEDARTVKAFLAKRQRIDGFAMTLPMVCRDSTLWKNFPQGSLPRYAWIDQNGVLGAITEGKEVTRENIEKWIMKGPFRLTNAYEKKFYRVNPYTPIYMNANGGERPSDVFVWSSSLSIGQDDNPAESYIFYDSLRGGYGITITNSPIVYLYGLAYNYRYHDGDFFDYLPVSRIQLLAKDTSKYYGDGTLSGNAFNYQLLSAKPKSKDQLMKIMQQDLYRYFGFDVKWKKQLKKCVVFTMFDSTLATKTKSLGEEAQMYGGKIILDSVSVRDIITVMEIGTSYYRDHRYPIIDETGYKGLVTGLREKGNRVDPEIFDKILSKHGLHLKFEMREVDVLVLKEPE